ncbi:MAG: hypothetical protein WDW38_001895 [Sanguina aurantia]
MESTTQSWFEPDITLVVGTRCPPEPGSEPQPVNCTQQDEDDARSVGAALANFGGEMAEMEEEEVPFDDNVMLDPEDIIQELGAVAGFASGSHARPTRSWESQPAPAAADAGQGAGSRGAAHNGMGRVSGPGNGGGFVGAGTVVKREVEVKREGGSSQRGNGSLGDPGVAPGPGGSSITNPVRKGIKLRLGSKPPVTLPPSS